MPQCSAKDLPVLLLGRTAVASGANLQLANHVALYVADQKLRHMKMIAMLALAGVPPTWYTRRVAAVNPRVQVTVDPELGAALAAVEPHPASKSRLIRDLALRGAEAATEAQTRHEEAIEFLCKVADGETDYDFDALGETLAERERSPFKYD